MQRFGLSAVTCATVLIGMLLGAPAGARPAAPRLLAVEATLAEAGAALAALPFRSFLIRLAAKQDWFERQTRAPRLMLVPVAGELSSSFGYRRDPLRHRRRFHGGIDFAARYGAPVRSAAAGTVVKAGWMSGYGRIVIVDHGDGLETYYAHLARVRVAVGSTLTAGQLLGNVGTSGRSTGPHLHFEARENGVRIDPLAEIPIIVRLIFRL